MAGWLIELKYLLNKLGHKFGIGTRLIIIVSLHILIIAGNAYIAYTGINKIEKDTKIINYSGMIRGGIQKVSKLETNGIVAKDDIAKIDSLFNGFLVTDRQDLLAHNMNAFIGQLENLQSEWLILKKTINNFHSNQSESNRASIVSQSDRCWDAANQTVYMAQALSEAKLSMFQIMFLVFFIDFLLIIAIIWLINSTVRHNLEVVSKIDALTGIYNRNVYNEEVYLEIERCKRYGYVFSMILIDIDFFKQINDNYGHDIGDNVLKNTTAVISKNIRKTDLFCRIGGEEFVIMATETDCDNARILSEKIRTEIESYDFGINRQVTISIGLTSLQTDDTKDTIFKRSDEALYQSKINGRNKITTL